MIDWEYLPQDKTNLSDFCKNVNEIYLRIAQSFNMFLFYVSSFTSQYAPITNGRLLQSFENLVRCIISLNISYSSKSNEDKRIPLKTRMQAIVTKEWQWLKFQKLSCKCTMESFSSYQKYIYMNEINILIIIAFWNNFHSKILSGNPLHSTKLAKCSQENISYQYLSTNHKVRCL